MDDTGAGYASFAHVLRLRPDVIKLDRSLLADIDHDAARRAFVTAVVLMALELGARVTAEGVETAAELDTLAALGVDTVQGFLLARPSTDPAVWARWAGRDWLGAHGAGLRGQASGHVDLTYGGRCRLTGDGGAGARGPAARPGRPCDRRRLPWCRARGGGRVSRGTLVPADRGRRRSPAAGAVTVVAAVLVAVGAVALSPAAVARPDRLLVGRWVAGSPTALDLTASAAEVPVGRQVTLAGRLTDPATGAGIASGAVRLEVGGSRHRHLGRVAQDARRRTWTAACRRPRRPTATIAYRLRHGEPGSDEESVSAAVR